MPIPDVPHTMPCTNCGATAQVVRSESKQGEQFVIARIEGKFYVPLKCPSCGRVQQEIKTPPPPHAR